MATENPTPVYDQKKRAFEALERRFAAAKADLIQAEQHCSKKRNRESSSRKQTEQPKPFAAAARSSLPNLQSPYTNKGILLQSCSTSQRKASGFADGENHPVYSEISEPLHENLLQGAILSTNKRDVVERVVTDMIQKGEESNKFARGAKSLNLKKENWILLDNHLPKDLGLTDARIRVSRAQSKRSKDHLSMKQHRKCGSFNFPKEFHNFDRFKPMHEMWKEYICELTKNTGNKQLAERLLTADLHGAFLLVVECKNVNFKGISGIMVRETAETFGIVSQDNRFQVVPKAGSVFILQAECWKITLNGNKLSSKQKLKESKSSQKLQSLLSR